MPTGGWLYRLCPHSTAGRRSKGANADLIRLHDAGDIPANPATFRTPFPIPAWLAQAKIGGRSNRTEFCAAACPRRTRSRRNCRRCSAIIPAGLKIDRPLFVAVSRPCS